MAWGVGPRCPCICFYFCCLSSSGNSKVFPGLRTPTGLRELLSSDILWTSAQQSQFSNAVWLAIWFPSSSSSITWQLVRNGNSWAPPTPNEPLYREEQPVLEQAFKWAITPTEVWEPQSALFLDYFKGTGSIPLFLSNLFLIVDMSI